MQHTTHDRDTTKRAFERRRVSEAEDPEHFIRHVAQEPVDRHGHRYGDIGIGSGSRAHIGDTTNHYHNGAQPQADKYETLLASLTFDRMDARLRNVATALPKTCEWLFYHKQFVEWTDVSKMHEHHGFLWVKGKPGSGKSTIMKETLAWAKLRWSAQTVLSYFFNARSTHEVEKSSIGLYRSLLYQLLDAHSSIRASFLQEFTAKVRHGKVEDWTETELQNFLIELVVTPQSPSLVIFIDALDEGSDADVRRMVRFLEHLTRRATAAARPLRICLSSRHYPHLTIEKSLSLVVEDQPGHGQDIELYIRSELTGGDSPQMDDLRCNLRDRSAGIFLWVVLVVPMLNKAYDQGKSWVAMLRKLEEIPLDLHNIFAQIFSSALEDLDECITLLEWVLFSLQPLSPAKLYHAVQYTCFKTGTEENVALTRDAVVRYLLNCSRGLVEITKTRTPIVQFIHETVREYLIGGHMLRQRQPGILAPYGLRPGFRTDSCHMKLSETCLHYLLNVCKAPLTEEVLEQHSFALYAAKFWWQHLQLSQSLCNQRVLDLAVELLTGIPKNLLLWVQLYNVDVPWRKPDLSQAVEALAPPLYYTARIGLPELALSILDLGADVNAGGGKYGAALQAASVYGHEKVVHLLLDRGAEVNARGGEYGTALQAASHSGHEKVVQILLERGAKVNARGGDYGTALRAASVYGHEKVVQMLLDRGAEVNAQGVEYGTALEAASYSGHEQVVQMLLDRGAEVNTQGGRYGTALRAASVYGHEKVVQMLLDRGAEVNAQERWYGTILRAASANGHEKVVQMLLDRGAEANAPGGRGYGTALQAACIDGHEKVVQMLLDRGAEVNAQGGRYGTALRAASVYGHEKVVQMLLDRGAELNAPGGRAYGTALQAASVPGHEEVVQMLLDQGAELNAQGGREYGTVLQAASVWVHEKVVQILLNRGAEVNAQGGRYGTALRAASANGHEKVVQMLLDRGAEVNAQGGRYGTALRAASANGHEEVVQMLLDRGAEVNAQGGRYGTALRAASANGHEKVVQMLLDRGAELNAPGGRAYGTALQAASVSGHEKVVQMLLDRGAEVGTALQTASDRSHEKVVQMLLDAGAEAP